MAHLQRDDASGRFRLRFRYAGIEYKRSVKTANERTAEGIRARVEETLRLLELGRLEVPDGADPGWFILSDGKRTAKPEAKRALSVGALFRLYRETLPPGAKEESTLLCEDIHTRHLLRHVPASRAAQSLTVSDLQRYADARSRDTWRGRTIGPDTVRKELATFRLIWNWAVERGHLAGPAPVKGVRLSKPDEKPPFMTWSEIEAVIARGGLSETEQKALWGSLFLDVTQVTALLDHVEQTARHPFVYTTARSSDANRSTARGRTLRRRSGMRVRRPAGGPR